MSKPSVVKRSFLRKFQNHLGREPFISKGQRRKEAVDMKHLVWAGAVVIGLIAAGSILAPVPAEARSIQRDGYFGGTWSPIGPGNNKHVKRYHRRGGSYYAYYGPRYYGYGAPWYWYGPRSGLSFGFSF